MHREATGTHVLIVRKYLGALIMALSQLTTGLAEQQAERTRSLKTLQQMRSQAREEIDRLIQFLDQSDPYFITELEDDASAGFAQDVHSALCDRNAGGVLRAAVFGAMPRKGAAA